MRTVWLLMVIIAMSLIIGCAQRQSGTTSPPVSSGSAIGNPQPQASGMAVETKHAVPAVLGKSKKKVQELLGVPDQISKVTGSWFGNHIDWEYANKPVQGFQLTVYFARPEGGIDKAGNNTILTDTVQQVRVDVNDWTSPTSLSASQAIPQAVLARKPDAIYFKPSAVDQGQPHDKLLLSWRFNHQAFFVGLDGGGQQLCTNSKELNASGDEIRYSYHLTSTGSNWQALNLLKFEQCNWSKSDQNELEDSGDFWSGFQKVSQ